MTLNRIIVRPGGVGDSLLLAPALTVLRREFPGLRTALAGYPERLAPLLQANLADALIPLEVWLNHPEGLPDRDTSGENSCLCSSVPPRIDSFFPQKPAWLAGTASEALFHLHPILPEGGNSTHVAEHLAHCLGLSPPIRCTSPLESLLPFDRERQESHRIWIHPGAGGKNKRWPLDFFLQIAGKAVQNHFSVVFLAGEAEEDLLPGLQRSGLEVMTPSNLSEMAGLFLRQDWFLGNDSGITHLAALCGLKTFAIFGPGDPVLWSPWGKDVTVIHGEASAWPSVQAVWEGICVNRP